MLKNPFLVCGLPLPGRVDGHLGDYRSLEVDAAASGHSAGHDYYVGQFVLYAVPTLRDEPARSSPPNHPLAAPVVKLISSTYWATQLLGPDGQ